jgi:hypothetical protein
MATCGALARGEARVLRDGERGAQTAHGGGTGAYEQAKEGRTTAALPAPPRKRRGVLQMPETK